MRELNAVFLQEDNVHTNIPDLSATCAPPACTKLMFPMCSIPANTPSTSCIWSIERCITSKACYKQEEQHNIYCVRNILHLLNTNNSWYKWIHSVLNKSIWYQAVSSDITGCSIKLKRVAKMCEICTRGVYVVSLFWWVKVWTTK